LGSDPSYAPAIYHALTQSDAVTTVSNFLAEETRRLLGFEDRIDVIYNFFEPDVPSRSVSEVRRELGVADNEAMIVHSSNLRQTKRIDLLLKSVSLIQPRSSFKLVVLAGASFAPFMDDVRALGLEDNVVVRENVLHIEDYLQAADIGLITSESESFCLSILEAMAFSCPGVATQIGGIPEVVRNGETGLLVPFGDADAIARAVETLIKDVPLRKKLGANAKAEATKLFGADVIVPQYEKLYQDHVARRSSRMKEPCEMAPPSI
jgi:N-acetyl-alpha-D-glucosaminyl L-malate synthase BshA